MRKHQGWVVRIFLIAVLIAPVLLVSGCGDSTADLLDDFDAARDGVPVVTYHYFREGNSPARTLRSIGAVLFNLPLIPAMDYWSLSSGDFERHLRYLEEQGYRTVTMAEVVDHMRGRSMLRGKCIALTFDDGDRSVYRYAYPLLRERGMRGTIFVVTSRIGQRWNDLELCSIEELREMERSGVIAIESHTHDLHYKIEGGESPHPAFDLLSRSDSAEERAAVLDDLVTSRRLIAHLFGSESRVLAWPFGFGSALSDSIAAEAGFEGICSLYPGTNPAGESPYFIRRYTVTARTSIRVFRLMASGLCDEDDGS